MATDTPARSWSLSTGTFTMAVHRPDITLLKQLPTRPTTSGLLSYPPPLSSSVPKHFSPPPLLMVKPASLSSLLVLSKIMIFPSLTPASLRPRIMDSTSSTWGENALFARQLSFRPTTSSGLNKLAHALSGDFIPLSLISPSSRALPISPPFTFPSPPKNFSCLAITRLDLEEVPAQAVDSSCRGTCPPEADAPTTETSPAPTALRNPLRVALAILFPTTRDLKRTIHNRRRDFCRGLMKI